MSFNVTDLDAACLSIGDDFTVGASPISMVPSFTPETDNSDVHELRIGERLTAETTSDVIDTAGVVRGSEITHVRTGKVYVVLGLIPDDTGWVTVELERS